MNKQVIRKLGDRPAVRANKFIRLWGKHSGNARAIAREISVAQNTVLRVAKDLKLRRKTVCGWCGYSFVPKPEQSPKYHPGECQAKGRRQQIRGQRRESYQSFLSTAKARTSPRFPDGIPVKITEAQFNRIKESKCLFCCVDLPDRIISVDRINPLRPYTVRNSRAMCSLHNHAKVSSDKWAHEGKIRGGQVDEKFIQLAKAVRDAHPDEYKAWLRRQR
jgi:hypothetical protein